MSINWHDLFNAIALVMIIEGLLPFVSPDTLKKSYETILELPENTLRMIGLVSILLGLFVLFIH